MSNRKKVILIVIGIVLFGLLSSFVGRKIELYSHGTGAMADAFRADGTTQLQTLLDLGASPNWTWGTNRSILNYVARENIHEGIVEKLEMLLDYGAKVDIVDEDGLTAYEYNLYLLNWENNFYSPAEKKPREMLNEVLLAAGASETEFSTMLSHDWDTIKRQIENNPSIINKRFYKDLTILHISTAIADNNFTTYLLEKGADPNTPSLDGFTPLETAIQFNKLDTVKLMLDHHAELTPGCLSSAALNVNFEMVQLLLEAGADINQPNENGYTALHNIVGRRQLLYIPQKDTVELRLQMIQTLLDAGADPFDDSLFSNSPWQLAQKQEFQQCLELFKKNTLKKAAHLLTIPH